MSMIDPLRFALIALCSQFNMILCVIQYFFSHNWSISPLVYGSMGAFIGSDFFIT